MTFKIFTLWAFILIGRPQDLIPGLMGIRPAFLLTIITFGFTFFSTTTLQLSELFKIKEVKLYTLFYLIMILGIPFAYHRQVAFDFIFFNYLINVLFFYILLLQVDSFERLKRFLTILLICSLFYSVFSLTLGAFSQGRFFTYGSVFDPNDIAYVLISLFPLSLFYVVRNDGILKKILAIVTIGASIPVILLSGSRGGLLGLITVFLLIFFTRMGSLKFFYKLLILLSIVMIANFYSEKINIDRYLTLTEVSEDYNMTDEFGRLQVWKKGLELFFSNPITGVGVNCFAMAIGYLRGELFLIPFWQAPHNSYLQIAAETGIIGFVIFILIIYITLKNFADCRKLKTLSEKAQELAAIAGLFEISFIGHLIAAFFLSQGYSIFFMLFFALSIITKKLYDNLLNENGERV
jgi:O-antigen ligase